jgi:protein-disulfide isomerase
VAKGDASALTPGVGSAVSLALMLCATAATGEGLDLSPEERAAFGAEVRALLLDEPQIVGRALGIGPVDPFAGYADEAARDAALLAESAAALTDDPGDWREGPADGLPLVSFLPPACDGCADLLADLRATATATGARLVVKDVPEPEAAARFLTAVHAELGPDAWIEARAALAGVLDADDPEALLRLAGARGWPVERLTDAMESRDTRARIERVRALADGLGFDLAPSYVAGGILVRGDVPPAVLARYLGR